MIAREFNIRYNIYEFANRNKGTGEVIHLPEISRFYGIVVKMIFNDNDKHHKPHVHVYYGEYEASVGLDCTVLEGSLPAKQYRILAGWMAIHEDELYAAWNNAVRSIPFERIEPLH